jgi:anti-sigma factor RsiW
MSIRRWGPEDPLMTCRELADFLMDYVNGDLPPDVHGAFERHLSLCQNCVAYVSVYKSTIALGRRAFLDDDADAATEVPEDLVRAILTARREIQ